MDVGPFYDLESLAMSRKCWEQAAKRHWRDAETLLGAQPSAIENADQLLGYAADSVANIILDLAATAEGRRFAPPDAVHINLGWNELVGLKQGRKFSSCLRSLPSSNPFKDWSVRQRYSCDGSITMQALDNHKNAAKRLLDVLDKLHQAGILT